MTEKNTANVVITIENVRYIPHFEWFRQIDGETPEEVARRYPGRTMYQLAHDYTTRVWVDTEAKE